MGAAASVPGNVRSDVGEVAMNTVDAVNQLGDAIAANSTVAGAVDVAGEVATGAVVAAGNAAAVEAMGGVSLAVVELANRIPEPHVDVDGVLNNDDVWRAGESAFDIMKSATGSLVEGGEDLLSTAVPSLLAIGTAVPIFGVIAGLAGKFYVTYLEAGVNQLQFKELKEHVDYAVQQLATGSDVVKTIQFPKGHIIFISLQKLAVSIYEAASYIKKFTKKYSSMQARMGNTDMDKKEIDFAMGCITRAIDNFRQDLTAYAATVTLRNDQVSKLRELLVPAGFDALMDAHRNNVREDVDPMATFLADALAWVHGSVGAGVDAQAQARAKVLAVVAEDGMSKSMFTTLLIDSLLSRRKPKVLEVSAAGATADRPCSTPDIAPCFFFCRARDEKRSSGAALVRSLAFQMAHCLPDMESRVLEAAKRTVGENDADELFQHMLLRPLQEYSEAHAAEVRQLNLLFIIDGVNQLGVDESDRERLLQSLAKKLRALPSWVRAVVTCTPKLPGFDDGMAKGATRMAFTRDDAAIAAELRLYIRGAFAKLLADQADLDAVVDEIFTRSNNSFLYVLYAVDEVQNSDPPLWTLTDVKSKLPLVYSSERVNKLMEMLRKKNPKLFAQYQADGLSLLSNVSDTLAEGMGKLGGMLSGFKAKVGVE